MDNYQKVRSSHAISISIADYLGAAAPQTYNSMNRAGIVRAVNDILQGRSAYTVEALLDGLRQIGGEIEPLQQEVQAFLDQKALLSQPYAKIGNKQYSFKTLDLRMGHPLKIIDQQIYDRAARDGFPADFFEKSYFDRVTFYALPDNAVCSDSCFQNCEFIVCRLMGTAFWDAQLYGCEFHSCLVQTAVFPNAVLAHTHFRDCHIPSAGFIRSRLIRCNLLDCTVGNLHFTGTALDGCSLGRIERLPNSHIRGLDTDAITMSGATAEEVKNCRRSIFKALGMTEPEPRQRGRLAVPER